jgi:hypothetical protein
LATDNAIITPTKATLSKYGLSVEAWQAMLDAQGGACGACGRVPPSRRLNIDHQHVRGWKTMDPVIRVTYVRGLLCYTCNSQRLARGATVANLRGAADYLERYQTR